MILQKIVFNFDTQENETIDFYISDEDWKKKVEKRVYSKEWDIE
jgi:hypothetical protein